MSLRTSVRFGIWIALCLITAASSAPAQERAAAQSNAWTADFRHAPPVWQTSICLPDDWQKTLVARDGTLLYDYAGGDRFRLRITPALAGRPEWVRQELASPRFPLVRTIQRMNQIELAQEVFAVAPRLEADPTPGAAKIAVQRVGDATAMKGWASAALPVDPAFSSIAVGWGQPIRYRFPAAAGEQYTVVLGLCEGHHTAPEQRILDLQIEGKTRHTVDMIASRGQNVPALFAFDASDDNADGSIDITVATAKQSPDTNPILNVLWVFRRGEAPSGDELITGKSRKPALAYVNCGSEQPPAPGQLSVERIGPLTGASGWAAPRASCDPAFNSISVGFDRPLRYRFRSEPNGRYVAVFGLCEGHHAAAGQRVLDLQVDGKTRRTVDMIAERGRNVPAGFAFDAADDNGDGFVDLAVAPAFGSPDTNTILNVLWVFRDEAPPLDELLLGVCGRSALARIDCGDESEPPGPARHDMVLLRLANKGDIDVVCVASVTIETDQPLAVHPARRQVRIGPYTTLISAEPFDPVEEGEGKLSLLVSRIRIRAGGQKEIAFCVVRGDWSGPVPVRQREAQVACRRAEQFWEKADLPYGRIAVPDDGIQALLDSSIRNIYQAREIKKGLPAFQVGPTCYRGLWVVDGSFLMEAVAYLGRVREARDGIKYLLSFQREDGAFMLLDGHWKETGIAIWAVTRHARLTGAKEWLREVWPNIERGFAYIRKMRSGASTDPAAPNAGLIPAGFSDGGLAGKYPEYTNVYWTLVGTRAAVEAARWLGKQDQADDWQREHDDFYATFRRAAERDMRTDAHGDRYLPIRMQGAEDVLPQKAQWGFCHAVFPGRLFAPDDPLVKGNMAMLKAVEQEGLVLDTGWLAGGLWNYFGSFYAHAWLWLGQGQKAARTLYAFANHASPLLVWREEHMPQGKGQQHVGDMPHNWASAEFIRLVRHLLALERGDELHLFEGMPPTWARPGAVTRLKDVVTEFGPLSLELRVDKDGKSAHLQMTPPSRTTPAKIVLHLDGWSGHEGTIELPTTETTDRRIELKPHVSP